MSFRLSKEKIKERDAIRDRLSERSAKLMAAVEGFNAGLDQLKAPVEAALEEYNETVGEAREFAEDIVSQADSDIGDKSERWQESERGQAAEAWKSEWESLSLDDIDIDFPEELSVDEPDHADQIEGASEQAE